MKVLNDSKRMRLDRIQSIFKMHEQGFGNRQIAAKCFCSASTVSETLNKYRHPNGEMWARDVLLRESEIRVGQAESIGTSEKAV